MKIKGLTRRGKIYWLRRSIEGKLVSVSLGTKSLEEAVNKITAAERNMRDEDRADRESASTSEAAIADFLAFKKNRDLSRSRLDQLDFTITRAMEEMECDTPAQATARKVNDWLSQYSNLSTRKVMLDALQVFFAWLKDKGRITVNPCASVEIPPNRPRPVRKRFLTPEQVETVLSTDCDAGLKFALFAMLHAGLRYGEVCAARPEWFDLHRGILHVTESPNWRIKNSKLRSIPLTARFREFLGTYGLRSPFMLRPEKAPGKSLYRVTMLKPFQAHMKACGAVCTYHDLRRTFASLHVSAGTPIFIVAKWLGDTIKVTEMHYAHLHHSGDDIENAWR